MKESSKDVTSCNVQKEKRLVGRPKIQQSVKILNEHDNESKRPSKHRKKQGAYQNWFQPHFWPQILDAMKKYGNNRTTLTFLQNVFKSPWVLSLYAKLIMSIMWEWLTKEGELKENYMEVAKHGTIVKNPKQNMPEFKES